MTSPIDSYAHAWEFATLMHMGQTYGGRREGEQIPYINHLASVAAEVAWGLAREPGWDLDLAIQCALLHDVVEDNDATIDEVRDQFGAAVASGVLALSKDAAIASRAEQMEDSLRRIRVQPREIWAVKLADRITNLYHPPFYWTTEKIAQYKIESNTILHALGEASQPLAARLAHKIAVYAKPSGTVE